MKVRQIQPLGIVNILFRILWRAIQKLWRHVTNGKERHPYDGAEGKADGSLQ